MKVIGITEAVEKIRSGQLVVLPTETVYGLAADAFNEIAVKRIFEIKGRPKINPLILHVDGILMLEKMGIKFSEFERSLMKKFWPGPLTLVLKKNSVVPSVVTAGLDTVCVRMPNNEIMLEIIRKLGRPIAAPSANLSGRPSPTTLEAIFNDFGKVKGLAVVDGGRCQIGIESTIVKIEESENSFKKSKVLENEVKFRNELLKGNGEVNFKSEVNNFLKRNCFENEKLVEKKKELRLQILRLGAISVDRLSKETGLLVEVVDSVKGGKVLSPGMKFKHYAPEVLIRLIKGGVSQIKKEICLIENVGVIDVEENVSKYEGIMVFSLGKRGDEAFMMRNLYDVLLKTEKVGLKQVLVNVDEFYGVILERFKRASGEIG